MAVRADSVEFGRASHVDPWRNFLNSMYEELDPMILDQLMHDYVTDDTSKVTQTDEIHDETLLKFIRCFDRGDTNTSAKLLQEKLDDLDIYTEWGEKWANKVQEIIEELDNFMAGFKISHREIFVGRQKEIQEYTKILQSDTVKCLCINGLAGQGKSVLAHHLLYDLFCSRTTPWNCLLVDVRDRDGTDLMVESLAKELRSNAATSYRTSSNEPNTFVAEILKSTTSETVWLLDNCDLVYEEDKRMFLRFLKESIESLQFQGPGENPKVKLLLTMRQQIDMDKLPMLKSAVKQISLSSLTAEDAVQLLTESAGKSFPDDEEDMLTEIVQECACSPQAVSFISGLLRDGDFTPRKLRFHLKNDTKNVTKALSVNDCIKQAVDSLSNQNKICLVKLTVFQTMSFTQDAAEYILSLTKHSTQDLGPLKYENIIQTLLNRNLLQMNTFSRRKPGSESKLKNQLLMQQLVYRYLMEMELRNYTKKMKEALNAFIEYFEKKIAKIATRMTSDAMKGLSELQENRDHIVAFYNVWDAKRMTQKPYSKNVKAKDILKKMKVVDVLFLSKLISDVKKRRIFASESERAKHEGNAPFQIFWKVQEANVLVVQHDKASIALEELDKLSSERRFSQLAGLGETPYFTYMVHASFHVVKGKCLSKQRKFQEALDHFQLARGFYDMGKDDNYVCHLKNQVLKHIAVNHLDQNCHLEAERVLHEAFHDGNIGPREGHEGGSKKSRQFSIELSEYKTYFGVIELRKALTTTDLVERDRHLVSAQKFIEEGLQLDEQLKMDNLDGFPYKMMIMAEIFVYQGQLDVAISSASCAMDQRREMLQLPHFGVTECVYLMARLHVVKAGKMENSDAGKQQLRIARSYFSELEEHHLLYGGIAIDHPLVQDIKKAHLYVLHSLGDTTGLNKTNKFYKKLLGGELAHETEGAFSDFKRMMHTVTEIMSKAFSGGGREFGEKNVLLTRDGAGPDDEDDDTRRDSAVYLSSTDGEGSLSLSSEGGSLTADSMARAHLESSVSLEDDVFDQEGNRPIRTTQGNRRPPLKKARTIED